MNTFNYNRFSQALKCHFLVERKTWIRLFGIYTLVMFMANLFFTRVRQRLLALGRQLSQRIAFSL